MVINKHILPVFEDTAINNKCIHNDFIFCSIFFLVFTFLLLSQVSLQHVQTPHTFSILHNAKKIQFRFEIFRFQSQNTDQAYNTLLKYARSREKYTAGGKKKSWKYSSMTATEKLVLFTSALVQNWETKREAFAKTTKAACAGWKQLLRCFV